MPCVWAATSAMPPAAATLSAVSPTTSACASTSTSPTIRGLISRKPDSGATFTVPRSCADTSWPSKLLTAPCSAISMRSHPSVNSLEFQRVLPIIRLYRAHPPTVCVVLSYGHSHASILGEQTSLPRLRISFLMEFLPNDANISEMCKSKRKMYNNASELKPYICSVIGGDRM